MINPHATQNQEEENKKTNLMQLEIQRPKFYNQQKLIFMFQQTRVTIICNQISKAKNLM